MLKHVGRVKKESPDQKSRRASGQGFAGAKGKLDKKKVGSVRMKKKSTKGKPGFSSDSRVKCDWCEESFCRWVLFVVAFVGYPCFRFREMVPHILRDHGFHVRINCKVRGKTGFCSWSCGSKLHCYTRHLKVFHGVKKSGHGEFPKDLLFLTATRDHLKKGVSYTLISRSQ